MPRSGALLAAAGYRVVALAEAVATVWPILAVSPRSLVLCAVVDALPRPDLGIRYGPPPGFPECTKRILHCYRPGEPLPATLAL